MRFLTRQELFLLIVSLVICFTVLEATVRLVQGNQPVFRYPQVALQQTEWGYKMRANQENVFHLDQPVRTNSIGFRGREWSIDKKDSEFRIMFLGDSLTFGNGVAEEEIYSTLLEKRLDVKNRNANVLNASVGGWNAEEETAFYVKEGYKFSPDLLIVGVYINDFLNPPPEGTTRRVIISQEGFIDGRPEWLKWLPYQIIYLLKRSALITYVRDLVGRLGQEEGWHTKVLNNQIDLENDQKLSYTYGLYDKIIKTAANQGTKVMFMHIPSINLFWVSRGKTPEYVESIKSYAEEQSAVFVDISRVFEEKGETNSLYLYPWDNHLSAAGHEVIAAFLENEIARVLVEN